MNSHRTWTICLMALFGVVSLAAQPRTQIKPATVAAFDDYIEEVEQSLRIRRNGHASKFLVASENRNWNTSLREGVIKPEFIEKSLTVPGGMIQDWTATMFVRGASGEDVIALLTDYDGHADLYDEVAAGKVLSREGDMVRSHLRLRKHKVITVVLDTEHELEVIEVGEGRWQLHSRSTHINEVRNAGEANETRLPEGNDGGFLWRMNAYWSIEEAGDGAYVECRSTTLTRGTPFGLGWIIKRFTVSLPRESLVATLEATRDELMRRAD